jgi:hypothetical protein
VIGWREKPGGANVDTEIRKLVLLPRFTTYAGARTFLTVPVNVREFSYVKLAGWRGPGIGDTPTFEIQVQTSNDLENWVDVGSPFDPGDGDGNLLSVDLFAEWIRLAVTLGGTGPAFTCWSVGNFATRTPQRHGGGR